MIKIKDMLKFIIPAVIFFLIVLFWEKINEKIYQKFKVKINLVILTAALLFVLAVLILLYFSSHEKILSFFNSFSY